jgi:hypothetical protein
VKWVALAAMPWGSLASKAGSSAKVSKRAMGDGVGLAVLGQAALGEDKIGGGRDAHVGFAVADHQHPFVTRGGLAFAVARGRAASVAGMGEVDAPAVLVDLAQAVGDDRQQGHVVARKDPRDALLDAVADHFKGRAQANDVVDEIREVRVDLDGVEIRQQFGRCRLDQRQLAAQAFAGTDMAIQPLLLDGFPLGAGEALENIVDDIGGVMVPSKSHTICQCIHLRLPWR